MILKYGDPKFDPTWLELIAKDPVHPTIPVKKRVKGTRTVFAFIENEQVQCLISVKLAKHLPHTIPDVLKDERAMANVDKRDLCAVFYSIFKLPEATTKGAGATAIKEAIALCKAEGIEHFYTLSPIPNMRKDLKMPPSEAMIRAYLEAKGGPVAKFHVGNGAKVHSINYQADASLLRMNESWGIMVNYDYS